MHNIKIFHRYISNTEYKNMSQEEKDIYFEENDNYINNKYGDSLTSGLTEKEEELTLKYMISKLPSEGEDELSLTVLEKKRAEKILEKHPRWKESIELFLAITKNYLCDN